MKNFIIALKWIFILPVAILGAIAIYFITNFCQVFLVNPESFYAHYIIPMISSFSFGISFVYFGIQIAPSHKQRVSLSFLIMGCICAGISMCFNGLTKHYFEMTKDILCVVGIIAGYIGSPAPKALK